MNNYSVIENYRLQISVISNTWLIDMRDTKLPWRSRKVSIFRLRNRRDDENLRGRESDRSLACMILSYERGPADMPTVIDCVSANNKKS